MEKTSVQNTTGLLVMVGWAILVYLFLMFRDGSLYLTPMELFALGIILMIEPFIYFRWKGWLAKLWKSIPRGTIYFSEKVFWTIITFQMVALTGEIILIGHTGKDFSLDLSVYAAVMAVGITLVALINPRERKAWCRNDGLRVTENKEIEDEHKSNSV